MTELPVSFKSYDRFALDALVIPESGLHGVHRVCRRVALDFPALVDSRGILGAPGPSLSVAVTPLWCGF